MLLLCSRDLVVHFNNNNSNFLLNWLDWEFVFGPLPKRKIGTYAYVALSFTDYATDGIQFERENWILHESDVIFWGFCDFVKKGSKIELLDFVITVVLSYNLQQNIFVTLIATSFFFLRVAEVLNSTLNQPTSHFPIIYPDMFTQGLLSRIFLSVSLPFSQRGLDNTSIDSKFFSVQ